MFCGDPGTSGYASCAEQEGLFVIASLLPATLALVLMAAAFATPAVRRNPALRTQTLGYSLIAWCLAGFTMVLGALPPL